MKHFLEDDDLILISKNNTKLNCMANDLNKKKKKPKNKNEYLMRRTERKRVPFQHKPANIYELYCDCA